MLSTMEKKKKRKGHGACISFFWNIIRKLIMNRSQEKSIDGFGENIAAITVRLAAGAEVTQLAKIFCKWALIRLSV